MTLVLLWLQLAGAAAVILIGANFLTKSADVIAFKTGLGRAFIGVILLATATSLPELGTGLSAVAWLDEPDLAAGDAFGSNLFNLLIIGLLDIFWREGPILRSVSAASLLVGVLGIAVIALAGAAVIIHSTTTTMANWFISPMSVGLIVVFLAAMYMIYRAEQDVDKETGASADDHQYASVSMSRAVLIYLMAAAVVVGGGIWLALSGDKVAEEMGWEASFVGTQFLAFSTSLPELATSFAAIRLNAPELAITNVLGSNLFNMGIVLFLDDVAYTSGAFWNGISEIHALTAMIAIGMTAVVIIALLGHLRSETTRFWKVETPLLIGLYATASLLVFFLS